MEWDKAIERNKLALVHIIAALFTLLVSARLSGVGLMVPRSIWRKVLIVLRPAEAAVRRLIIVAARSLGPVSAQSRKAPSAPTFAAIPRNPIAIAPVFQLFDPLKTFSFCDSDGLETGTGYSDPVNDTPINADGLHYRLRALSNALADLSKQVRRLVRFQARRDAALRASKPTRLSLMRPGLPPGWQQRKGHEVDAVLRECHRLAQHSLDTS